MKCELQVVLCKHLSVHFRKRFHAAFGCCAVLEVRVCVCVCVCVWGGGGGWVCVCGGGVILTLCCFSFCFLVLSSLFYGVASKEHVSQ